MRAERLATTILIAVHSYLFWKLRQWLGGGFWQLPVLLLFALMCCMFIFRRQAFFGQLPEIFMQIAYIWLGFVLIAFVVFLASDIVRLLLYIIKWTSGLNITVLLDPSHMVPLLLLASLGLGGLSMYSARNVQLTSYTIATAKLPPGTDRLRLMAMSDVHLSESIGPRELRQIAALVEEQKPDVIAIAGDLVDTDMRNRDEDAQILRDMQASHGKYAVMGNHEYYRGLKNSRDFMRKSGLTILENRAVEDGSDIIVAGIDDPVMPRNPEAPADPAVLLKKQDQNKFILLIKHRPYVQPEEIGLFDLQVSGHTHGGQIWPMTHWASAANHHAKQGLSTFTAPDGVKKSLMFLSNGTGYWGPPMRFLVPPEVTVIDLVRE